MSIKHDSFRDRVDLESILHRVARIGGVTKDVDIAALLGTSRQMLSTWRKAGTIPYKQICEFGISRSISLDFLIRGHGVEKAGERVHPELLGIIEREFRLKSYPWDWDPEAKYTTYPGIDMGGVYNRVIDKYLEIQEETEGRHWQPLFELIDAEVNNVVVVRERDAELVGAVRKQRQNKRSIKKGPKKV